MAKYKGDGVYEAEVVPTHAGDHIVVVEANGVPITGSPFRIHTEYSWWPRVSLALFVLALLAMLVYAAMVCSAKCLLCCGNRRDRKHAARSDAAVDVTEVTPGESGEVAAPVRDKSAPPLVQRPAGHAKNISSAPACLVYRGAMQKPYTAPMRELMNTTGIVAVDPARVDEMFATDTSDDTIVLAIVDVSTTHARSTSEFAEHVMELYDDRKCVAHNCCVAVVSA